MQSGVSKVMFVQKQKRERNAMKKKKKVASSKKRKETEEADRSKQLELFMQLAIAQR